MKSQWQYAHTRVTKRHAAGVLSGMWPLVASLAIPARTSAQEFGPIAQDCWEAFRKVDYFGGNLGLSSRKPGIVVLRDSTRAFHECVHPRCSVDSRGEPFKEKALLTIDLRP